MGDKRVAGSIFSKQGDWVPHHQGDRDQPATGEKQLLDRQGTTLSLASGPVTVTAVETCARPSTTF
jgi:hypothetical protein